MRRMNKTPACRIIEVNLNMLKTGLLSWGKGILFFSVVVGATWLTLFNLLS